MATNLRLLIGTDIIDSVEGGATASTIDDTVFSFDFDSGVVSNIANDSEDISFRIRVNNLGGTDTDDVVTRVTSVMALLDTISIEGLIIEWETGKTLIEIGLATSGGVDYAADVAWGDDGAVIIVTVSSERINGNIMGTGGWQMQRNTAGRVFIIANLNYPDLATALAEIATFKDDTVKPTWMPDNCRVISDIAATGNRKLSAGIGSLTTADMLPVAFEIVWEYMADHMFNNTVFDSVKKAKWTCDASPRDPLDERAGNEAGLNVEITLDLEFKTEQSTDYDPLDPGPVAGSVLFSRAVACAKAILSEAESRISENITLLVDVERSVTGEDGVYTVTMSGVTGRSNRVLTWDEEEILEKVFRGKIVGITDGTEWEFEHPAGDEITIAHTLDIVSIGSARGYAKPVNLRGSGWRRTYLGDSPAKRLKSGGQGSRHYKTSFARNYRFINKGKRRKTSKERSRETTSGSQSSEGGHAGQFG